QLHQVFRRDLCHLSLGTRPRRRCHLRLDATSGRRRPTTMISIRPGRTAIVAIACLPSFARAQTSTNGSGAAATSSYVALQKSNGSFGLATGGQPAPLYVSAEDFPGVVRAVNDLRADLERVT